MVDYWTGLVGVTYTDASSKAVIASDVDEMVCVAPDYPAGVDDDRVINGTGVEIKNRESGKCLDVWSASGSDVPDYTNVDLYSCSGASNQVFTYDGSTIKHAASGKCLDNDASNGDSVQIFSCSGASSSSAPPHRVRACASLLFFFQSCSACSRACSKNMSRSRSSRP